MPLRSILCAIFIGLFVVGQPLAKPLVIAHRGASGYLPEHTLESAVLAYSQGADFIEQDLVLSKDNVLVVLHDIHLDTVTNVEQQFPERHRPDGRYYVIDFSLAELQTLRVHERTDQQGKMVFSSRYQGRADFRIATFEEQLELISQLNRMTGKQVGFYPEIKSPAWHRQQGRDISKMVLATLRKHQLDDPNKAVYIQSFDFAELKRWRHELGAKVKLVQLLGENDWHEASTNYDYLKTAEGLAEIATVAQGIGPWLAQVIDQQTFASTGLAEAAHKAGLAVHPYTFRQDSLPDNVQTSQLFALLFGQLQIDGLFSDFPDITVRYLQDKPVD
ncbi:glycerophosphodiester phosphodiesterase [Neptunicella sp. SCSIO 80796]|uniref:glycerophosphodiester phosphodiesterase n=1 Tax=Neptunicella plasticusilytica TaxID=3117012 RepID=UPI003A4DACD5